MLKNSLVTPLNKFENMVTVMIVHTFDIIKKLPKKQIAELDGIPYFVMNFACNVLAFPLI
jgi:hypothetical protein